MITVFLTSPEKKVKAGDRILYHREPGEVKFVVADVIGEPSRDWYVEKFPGGGLMITAKGFGDVFLGVNDIDEQLEFLSRSEDRAT